MAKSLGESPLHMHMIIVSYVLTVAVMLPASGWLADRVGVRNIFFTAIVLFTAGSLFCAQASTLDQLVMARVLQGVGGAMMGAGRPPDGDEDRPARSVYGGDDLRYPAGPGRPAARPGAGRGAGGVRLLALDLPHQYPGGDRRRYRHPLSDAQLHTMQTRRFDLSGFLLLAAGMATLTPGARRPERARHFPCLAGGAGGRRPLRPAALPVARPRQRPGAV